jgi:molybdopterin-guanine dinucleotide biosynthesis protein A
MSRHAFAAMILCGGASRRMGVDKGGLDWLGRRAVDRLVDVVQVMGATNVLTVGERDYGPPHVVEDPPLSGPVGGVLAGARALSMCECKRVLVVAVDAPTLEVGDIAPLLAAPAPGAAYDGLHLPFVAQLAALTTVADVEAGWPLRRLLEQLGVQRLPPPVGARERLRGANTPEERAVLLAELAAKADAQSHGNI